MRWQPRRVHVRDMPIRHKLLAIILLVALLISMVAFGGFQLVTRTTSQMLYEQTSVSLGVISDKIAARLNNITNISLYLAVNRDFQKNLDTINEWPASAANGVARSDISSLLSHTYHSDIIAISVLPLEATPIVLGTNSSPESEAVQARARELAAEAQGAVVWLPTGRSDGSVLCAREIRNVSRPFLDSMGLLLVRVDLNKIVNECSEDLLTGSYDIAIDQDGEPLYSLTQSNPDGWEGLVSPGDSPYAIVKQGGEWYFITRCAIKAFRVSWNLLLAIPYGEIFSSLALANSLFIASLVAAVAISVLLSRRMLQSINRDVQLLSTKMNRVRQGNLTLYPNPDGLGQDELGALNRHFDQMTADFKQVLDDNYVKELLLTQTQLKALEQQINPHFLYNSLESINWFARRGEGKNVSAIAQSLGVLLRETLSVDEALIPLERELTILGSYLNIQRIRFSDTLHVHTDVDDSLYAVRIPKMSIQPLVENAIVHSLEENIGECHIWIRVALSDGLVLVEVENDGSEIDEDILEKLRNREVRSRGNGIGLINIDSRIKLLFGQEYGIALRNAAEKVIVSFRIPADTPQTPPGSRSLGGDVNSGKGEPQ
ncbi:sensor histidine kinase [Ruminococcaceae bacterium OttesenSCG-928-L11]|nr:sensor histidine kinase [Ruminococcaceae bacterium OttesenSCG-928-L11]